MSQPTFQQLWLRTGLAGVFTVAQFTHWPRFLARCGHLYHEHGSCTACIAATTSCLNWRCMKSDTASALEVYCTDTRTTDTDHSFELRLMSSHTQNQTAYPSYTVSTILSRRQTGTMRGRELALSPRSTCSQSPTRKDTPHTVESSALFTP